MSRTTKVMRRMKFRNNSLKSRTKESSLNRNFRKTKAVKKNLASKTQRKNKNRGSNLNQFKKKDAKSRA